MRNRINATDRHIAGQLLMGLANHSQNSFCLSWVYDDDTEFLSALAKAIPVPQKFPGNSFLNRLRKVCRQLEVGGILYGRVSSCHKEYLGEPRTLKNYRFSDPGYAKRLAPHRHPHYRPMGKVETELDFLLDRAYPT